jgi:hypothetical protein
LICLAKIRLFYDGKRGNIVGTGSHYYWIGDNSGQFADPTGPSASVGPGPFTRATGAAPQGDRRSAHKAALRNICWNR